MLLIPLLVNIDHNAPLTYESAKAAFADATTISEWNGIRHVLAHTGKDPNHNARILARIEAEGYIVEVLGRDPE